MKETRICLLEDDKDLAYLLQIILRKQDFKVTVFTRGSDLLKEIKNNEELDYAAFIIDIMVPGINGDEIIDLIRMKSQSSLIMMHSAIDDTKMRIKCLNKGVDHYLVKPYPNEVLIEHIKSHLRKKRTEPKEVDINVNGWNINLNTRKGKKENQEIRLEHKELDIIKLLYQNDKPVSKKDLLWKVWEINEDVYTNRLQSTISSVRRKLGKSSILYKSKEGYWISKK